MRACAPRPRARSPRCRCRSACSNASPPDRLAVSAPVLAAASARCRRSGAPCWPAPTKRRGGSSRPFIPSLPAPAEPDRDRGAGRARCRREPPVEPAPRDGRRPQPAAAGAGPSLSDVVARIERRRRSRASSRPAPRAAGPGDRRAGAVPLGMRAVGRNRLGRRRAARRADRPLDCPRPGPGGRRGRRGGRPRLRAARAVPRCHADRAGRRAGRRANGRSAACRHSSPPTAASPAIAGSRCATCRRRRHSASVASEILADPDSLRELVHEIKTPLNAIIGFAEIIDGQYLGPADRRYRERAGDIVGQARLLLGAIDDLDFAAKIHSVDRAARPPGRPRASSSRRWRRRCASLAAERGVELEYRARPADVAAARSSPSSPTGCFTGCAAALIEQAGERASGCGCRVEQAGEQCRFSISRPAALRGRRRRAIVRPAPVAAARTSRVGIGFALRLVRGLARIAGGDLVASRGRRSLCCFRAPDLARAGASALRLSGPSR